MSVVPIEIPPLREYRDDIPGLVEHFASEMARYSGWNHLSFSEESVAMLQSYDWPGNVRELRNVIERILIMSPNDLEDSIGTDMIPAEINTKAQDLPMQKTFIKSMGLPLREARENFEREYLISQISRFGGNISRTANFVGMERSALHRKMKSLGIQSNLRDKDVPETNEISTDRVG